MKTATPERKKPLLSKAIALLLLTILFTAFYAYYLEGIPFEVDDVITSWHLAVKTSWFQMLGYLLSPVSEFATAHKWLELISVHVTETLLFKLIYSFFGDQCFPFIFIT